MYYFIAPSFLQSPFHLFAFHKAQVIICSVLLAVLFNVLTILKFHPQQGHRWLNAAITSGGTG